MTSQIMKWTNVGWLVGCILRPIDSEVIHRRHPHLLSLAKDVNGQMYNIKTGNGTICS